MTTSDNNGISPQNERSESDYSLPARRRSELLKVAKTRGSITVTEIAQEFAVSTDTIRRDLDYLSDRSLLMRTHGGAVPVDGFIDRDTPVAIRVNARTAEKARIAKAASALIVDGETLIINGGSTTRAFVGELGALRNLTIVTNNLGVPAAVPPNTTRGIYLLGGHVRQELQVTIGAIGFANSGPLCADTAIIGVGGISASGVSTTLLEESTMITAMMESARRVVVLADAAKFGTTVLAHISTLSRIHVLVTNATPPPDLMAALNDSEVEVIIAD
ncbi:DeoR/GlpR family DNA-binding transcription regulator [Roseibium sp. HPY-6]|uniref:DeoR/GlpR family DNA-binding transcription regulator n=1 Tax=Roseibium sp. HPY-6 TaxID=3229852 RepID=UPI003390332D